MRSLSAEEQALWERVTATIRPLSREKLQSGPAGKGDPSQEPQPSQRPHPQPRSTGVPARPRGEERRPLAAATLDSTWDRRLASGSVQPDRVIDLHGRTLDQAWVAIDRGLEESIAAGERVLLLITGHPRPGDPPVQRGKIRAAVHDWLAASRHARCIAAVRAAHGRHGGGGSLYIILRRIRGGSTFS